MKKTILLLLSVLFIPQISLLAKAENEAFALDLATAFRAARQVVSDKQTHINNPDIGDKGLSSDFVIAQTKVNFKAATGYGFDEAQNQNELYQKSFAALLESIQRVMDQVQPLINEKGTGFKGFLPAVFARQVSEEFRNAMRGEVSIKLTAPKDYVRNRKNRPDAFENKILEKSFRSSGWETNKHVFVEAETVKGQMVDRLMLPEYYGQGCLDCHGEPKGARDITGGKKEGGKLNDLGGAISIIVYN